MIKVATLYRLKDRQKGEYQINGLKVVERPAMKVEQSYIDEVNRNSISSGQLLVIDEEASLEFQVYKTKHEQTLRDNRKKASIGLGEAVEAIVLKNNSNSKDEGPKYNWGLDRLTAYANENSIDIEGAEKLKDVWSKVKETL